MGRSRGKRFDDEPKLNVKKVMAAIIAIIVLAMVAISVVALFKKQNVPIIESVEYFSLHKNNKWGVINSKGEIVIEPAYEEMIIIPDSKKEIFIYNYDVDYEKETYKTKIVNSKGEELFTGYSNVEALDNYSSIDDVWYEKNSLKFEKDGKYGLINYEGSQILNPEYEDIYTLKGLERSLVLVKDGKYGLYNDVAKDIILEPKYSEIKALGLTYNDGYIVKDEKGKYGLIGPDKKTILEIEYDEITNVYGGSLYLVKKDKKYLVVDSSGEIKLEVADKEEIKEIYNENFVFIKDKKYGVMDIEKNELISPIYDSVEHAYGSFYIAKKNKNYGVVNTDANVVIEFKYANITYRNEAAFFECENKDYTTDLYDNLGEYKLTGTINEVNEANSYIRIRVDEEYKYYNFMFEEKTNKEVLTNNTLFLVKENGKYGYVNGEGNKVVDCIYDDATEQNEFGFCAVQKDGKWGSLKADGTVVLEPSKDLTENVYIDFIGKWHLDTNNELNAYTE